MGYSQGMRRLCASLSIAVLLLAGCGGDEEEAGGGAGNQTATQEAPATTQEAPTTTQPATAQGKQLFTDNCAGCHTLADAGATGKNAPNLDELMPSLEQVRRQVTNGGGGMPAFRDKLSEEEIAAVAEYVSQAAGGG
jgi:mono/diheme cytochrome c family protein